MAGLHEGGNEPPSKAGSWSQGDVICASERGRYLRTASPIFFHHGELDNCIPSLHRSESRAKFASSIAFSTRLKAFHIINTPPFAGVLVELIKSVLSSKLAARVHVHGTDLTELHKQVPKESLPTEMGGCGGSIIDNWSKIAHSQILIPCVYPWLKKLETYQDWFLQHENVKSDEKKRLGGKAISSDLFGFEDSFKELDID
ncbi:hypothetical protein ANN_26706 [Periplaneta americana]|uniref:CRAL-TRIO domain-containing protein n=1 Tax=Periplaneta americana TaxID=6978 RepID=A0ABQ8RZ17_PERAM|nr:hypothetical protein ANN_26706 [Periplaneta americana]